MRKTKNCNRGKCYLSGGGCWALSSHLLVFPPSKKLPSCKILTQVTQLLTTQYSYWFFNFRHETADSNGKEAPSEEEEETRVGSDGKPLTESVLRQCCLHNFNNCLQFWHYLESFQFCCWCWFCKTNVILLNLKMEWVPTFFLFLLQDFSFPFI